MPFHRVERPDREQSSSTRGSQGHRGAPGFSSRKNAGQRLIGGFDSPTQLVGLVNLEDDSVWLLTHEQFERRAMQKPEGRLHLNFLTDEGQKCRPLCHRRDLRNFAWKRSLSDCFLEFPSCSASDAGQAFLRAHRLVEFPHLSH